MSDAPSRRVGTTVRNKWTLERLLGTGGMAAVYVGIHRIGRRDALKILHPEAAQSKEICERFEREAQAANRFRHPGAVEIRDIDITEDGAPFLVMELLDGESLADREQRLGRIVLPDVLRFAEQVLDTLEAAHAQGIIHRDIKPANLYVIAERGARSERSPRSRGGEPRGHGGERIKVLDFGLARIRQDSSIQGQLTRMGLVLGTTPYMPPEQAKGRNIDARADIFAVGATMYRLLSGRHVHEASSDFDLLMKMGKEPAPPLAERAPDVPRDVCLVVDRALAFDRDQRYADAALMLADLRAIASGEPPPYASRFAHGLDRDAATLQAIPTASTTPPAPRSAVPGDDSIAVDWNGPPAPTAEPVSMEWSDVAVSTAEPVSMEWSDVAVSTAEPVSMEWSDVAVSTDDSIAVIWNEEPGEAAGSGAAGSPAAPSAATPGSAPAPEKKKAAPRR